MEHFEKLLKKHGLRITKPRRLVFTALSQASTPLSHAEIYGKSAGIDRASVYRTIDTLHSIGVVKIVYIGWKKLYELTDLFSPHHHHLRCVACGKISHISDTAFEKNIENLAKQQGFKLVSHHFEIEGICPDCQQSTASEKL